MATPPSHPMARMVSLPEEIWKTEELVAVGPGEVRDIALKPTRPVSPGSSAAYHLVVGEQRMVMATATAPSSAAPPHAAAMPQVRAVQAQQAVL